MGIAEKAFTNRRKFLAAPVACAAALLPASGLRANARTAFDRAAYDRYIRLMNEADVGFIDYYADDIKFVMNIRGKTGVVDFYAAQRPYIKETLEVTFFCSDAAGAAAEVTSELRCIQDCNDVSIFGRALKAGEVQRIRGCLLYRLNAQGKIAEIKGPPPEILESWHMATTHDRNL